MRIVFDNCSMCYFYTETCRLPLSSLDDRTFICYCQLCSRQHHHHHHYYFRGPRYDKNYSKNVVFLQTDMTLTSYCPLWFSSRPFQNLKSHKCTYWAIIHLIIIKNRFRCVILISEYLLPLLILGSLFISIVITSSSSSLPSHSSW